MRHFITPLLLTLFAGTAYPQDWIQRADFPYPVYAPYGFSIGGRYFNGGGVTDIVPLALVDSFYEYNAGLDLWQHRTALPGPARYGTHGFSIGETNKGYVVCGWHNNIPQEQLSDLWEYDPGTDAWMQKADFPGPPRYSLVSIGTSTKAYAGLGYNPWHDDWYEYDPITDTWTQKTSFPGGARQAANAFVLNDEVYVGMGTANGGLGTGTFFDDLYRYDAVSDTWVQLASLPALPRANSYSFSSCGLAYIVGGIGFDSFGVQDVFTDMWQYDAALDSWTQLPDFPGTPMNTGTSFNISSSGFMGFGGTGFETASWVPDTLTGEFWELKGCATPTEIADPGPSSAAAWSNGQDILARWNATGTYDRFEVFDALGRLDRTGRIERSTALRVPLPGASGGVLLLRLSGPKAVATVRIGHPSQ
ncbi:MAG: hypothetical protein KA791_10220 [Flavobacteriales bacterium]|nr:hypothetical protein [Flavobacteriales bacterium]